MSNFCPTDQQNDYLMPPSVDEWLPQRHLARFVVEVVDGLPLHAMSQAYRGSGSAPYYPAVVLSLLVYGYATGVFSSRKLEASDLRLGCLPLHCGKRSPRPRTIATFRRRLLKEIQPLFVEVLKLAREMGVLQMGTVARDGTKIHANASRHNALSYEHAGEIEKQLKAEVASSWPQSRGRGSGGRAGWDVAPGRVGAARGAAGEARRGACKDRSSCPGTLRAGQRRLSGEAPVQAMAHRLKTPDGKKHYALRKQVPAAVPAARSGSCPGRMQPCHHGLEDEAAVRSLPRPQGRRGEGFVGSR
jgi:transposase